MKRVILLFVMRNTLFFLLPLLCLGMSCGNRKKAGSRPDFHPDYALTLQFQFSDSTQAKALLDSAERVLIRRAKALYAYTRIESDASLGTISLEFGNALSPSGPPSEAGLDTIIDRFTTKGQLEIDLKYRRKDRWPLSNPTKPQLEDDLSGNLLENRVFLSDAPVIRMEDVRSGKVLTVSDLIDMARTAGTLPPDSPAPTAIPAGRVAAAEVNADPAFPEESVVLITLDRAGTDLLNTLAVRLSGKWKWEPEIIWQEGMFFATQFMRPIPGGRLELRARFTPTEAQRLANMLASGILPGKVGVDSARLLR